MSKYSAASYNPGVLGFARKVASDFATLCACPEHMRDATDVWATWPDLADRLQDAIIDWETAQGARPMHAATQGEETA